MKTSKQIINDIPKNQALFHELTDYTKNYRELEYQKRNVEVEVRKLEIKNEELKLLKLVVQSIKQFFHKILNIGSESDKDSVVREIKEYYEVDLYNKKDLHDIADNTSKEQEINDYLYDKEYKYDDKDFEI